MKKNKSTINTNNKNAIIAKRLLLGVASIIFINYTYLFLLFILAAMMPTIITVLLDKKNYEKNVVVGFFNLAGAMPYLLKFIADYNKDCLVSILTGVLSWVVIYGLAGIGVLLYYNLPKIFTSMSKTINEYRLKQIDKNLEAIQEKWGDI